MMNKALREICDIIVEPVNPHDENIQEYLKAVEVEANRILKEYRKKNKALHEKRLLLEVSANLQLLRFNYECLAGWQVGDTKALSAKRIESQIGYIKFLKAKVLYDPSELDGLLICFERLLILSDEYVHLNQEIIKPHPRQIDFVLQQDTIKVEIVNANDGQSKNYVDGLIHLTNGELKKLNPLSDESWKKYVHTLITINEFALQENYKYLINNLELEGISKQLEYIAFMRASIIYESPFLDLDRWENNFNQLENRYRETMKQTSNHSPTLTGKQDKKKVVLSYNWQGDIENDLPELFKLLNKHIAAETTCEQFKMIFGGIEISKIVPVRWHDYNASEVLYFILRLAECNSIDEGARLNYKKLEACIVQPDGKKFSVNFKVLKTNIDINLSDGKKAAIEQIVSKF